MTDDLILSYDATDDDAHADGDPTLDDIDAGELAELAARMVEVQELPEGEVRNMGALGLWHEMYGNALVVI